MGRNYAGILGSLAFFTEMMRGLLHGAGVESTLLTAAISLFLFAFVGSVLGRLAGWIVLDSVRAQVAAELAAQPIPGSTANSKTKP